LEGVTQQIVNAIENALLYQTVLDKAERLTTLNRISTILSSSWQLDHVLPPLLSEMARVLGIELGVIVLRAEERSERYKVRARFGRWKHGAGLKSIPWHQLPLLKTISQSRLPVLSPKASQDERLKPLFTLIEQEEIRTVLLLPLIVNNQLSGFIQLCAVGRERHFEAAEVELVRTLANQAAVAIEKARLYEATITRYEEELEIARQIQQNLLPRVVPELPGLRLGGLCLPAKATSGDFYDYIPLPNHQLGIVVGDVTGKSLPAALVMALARNTIRSELVNNPHPAEAMTTANSWLCMDIRRGTFVATIQALLAPLEQKMWLVNAGQMVALVARQGQVQYLLPDEAIGFPLGIQPQKAYTQVVFPWQAGDTYLFYTDGIVEAKNSSGEMFGFERLIASFQKLQALQGPVEMIEQLLAEMHAFVGEAEQHDDITLVVVQVDDGPTLLGPDASANPA
jgi:serine phosphatase RsbU (regulator of sigma subunit)